MSMSTYVTGFKPPDEVWLGHKAVWDSCSAAGVDIPDATLEFFEHEPPDPKGVEVELPLREHSTDAESGYELDVASIPEGVTIIRFCNSW